MQTEFNQNNRTHKTSLLMSEDDIKYILKVLILIHVTQDKVNLPLLKNSWPSAD